MTQVGQILDNLGVDVPLEDGDQVISAVVIVSFFTEGQAQPRLFVAESENLSWIEKAGMLRLAECADAPVYMDHDDE